MLLSVDWDYYSGTVEHVFDAPIWGSRDQEADRVERWRERARKRSGQDWSALAEDFPLHGDAGELLAFRGIPTFLAWSHAHAWEWLVRFPGEAVLNFDSHHDLYSLSGDPRRVRPGNWAGLGLAQGLIKEYTCVYPAWHEEVRVAEGYDLDRTGDELRAHLPADLWPSIKLERGLVLPGPAEVQAVLLAQSPAWTNPLHDAVFSQLAQALSAEQLSEPYRRPWQ